MCRYLRWVASSSFLRMASCRLLASSWTFSCSSSCLACTEQEAFPAAALYMMQVVIESKEIRPMPSYWKPMYQPNVMHSAFGCKVLQLLRKNRCNSDAFNFSQGVSTNCLLVQSPWLFLLSACRECPSALCGQHSLQPLYVWLHLQLPMPSPAGRCIFRV